MVGYQPWLNIGLARWLRFESARTREAKEALVNDILQAVQTAIPGCKLERRSTTPLHATFTEGYKRTYTFDKAGANLVFVGPGEGCRGHEYRIAYRPEWYSGPVLSHAQARIIDRIPAYLGSGSKFVALNDIFHAIDIPDVTVDGKPDYVLLPAHLVDVLPSWAYVVVGPQRKDAQTGQMLNKGFLMPVMYRGGSHVPHFTIFPEYSDADAVRKLGNPLFPHESVNASGDEHGAR